MFSADRLCRYLVNLCPCALAALAFALTPAVFTVGPAFAVHNTGVFELDGNSTVDNAGQEDFDTIFAGPGSSFSHFFLHDEAEPDLTIHTGGDKVADPISMWGCRTRNNVNDKLDLRHAFAAAYNIGGELHMFFGGNRDDNNGDAGFGFWLFQDTVTAVDCTLPTGHFTGQKKDGDLFIGGNFTGGGATLVVELYRWNDPDGIPENGDETLTLLTPPAGSDPLDCQASGPDHHAVEPNLCATVNHTSTITTAWETDPSQPVEERQYIEGGINLTAILNNPAFFPNGPVCYKTLKIDIRSSQALGSDLEDFPFTTSSLATCGTITVNKVTSPAGSSQQFDFTTAGGPNAISDAFNLSHGGSHTTANIQPGSYTITEAVPSGWTLTATCTGGPFGSGATYTNGTTFVLNLGQSVVCDFTNAQQIPAAPPPPMKGIAHGAGLAAIRAGIQITGTFIPQGNINLGSASAKVTITSVLNEVGGSGEAVAGLPLTLLPHPLNNANAAIFKTVDGVYPIAIMKLGTPNGGKLSYRLQIAKPTIVPPSGCPATNLTLSFTLNDGVNPPLTFTIQKPWRCWGIGNRYLRTP